MLTKRKIIMYVILVSVIPVLLAFWDVIRGDKTNWTEAIVYSLVVVICIFLLESVWSMRDKG